MHLKHKDVPYNYHQIKAFFALKRKKMHKNNEATNDHLLNIYSA